MRFRFFLLITGLIFWAGFAGPQRALAAEDTCSPQLPCESSAPASPALLDSSKAPVEEKICLYYFWGSGCSQCAETTPFLQDLAKKYSDKIELKSFEVYYSEENRRFFDDFIYRYQIKLPGVPALFVGDSYFGGSRAIKSYLEAKIEEYLKNPPQCPLEVNFNKYESATEKIKRQSLTLPVVVVAALADSINPCAFAVLIFLLVYLLGLKAESRVVKTGLAYIATVFVVYFLSGVGLLKLIQYSGTTVWVARVAGVVALVAGLINIKDFFWYGRGITLAIPASKKPLLEKYIRLASVPAAVVLGFLVSAFELPCTGGAYLAILSLLAKQTTRYSAIGYLVLYNLIFVLPLVVIVLLVSRGSSPEKLEALRVDRKKWLRLGMGLVMVSLGLGLLLGWF